MDDLERWARALRAAAGDPAARIHHICELCARDLEVTGVGMSMVTDAQARGVVVCSTDEISARIEDLQITLGEGPCVDAIRSGTPVLAPDLSDADGIAVARWPAFMDAAAKDGVRAVFALPLRIGAIEIGAVDLYRDQPGPLAEDQLGFALMAADAAALALLDLDFDPDGTSRLGLDSAMTVQLQVHQATGMVKVQLGVGIEQAFLRLRAHAFSTGRPLLDVAVDVVEQRLRFSPEDQ